MYRYNQNENKFNKEIRRDNQIVELTNQKKYFLMHSEHKNEMNRSDENTRNSQIKLDKNKTKI